MKFRFELLSRRMNGRQRVTYGYSRMNSSSTVVVQYIFQDCWRDEKALFIYGNYSCFYHRVRCIAVTVNVIPAFTELKLHPEYKAGEQLVKYSTQTRSRFQIRSFNSSNCKNQPCHTSHEKYWGVQYDCRSAYQHSLHLYRRQILTAHWS